MQTIEFEANLTNGLIQVPSAYRNWYNLPVRVILRQHEQQGKPEQEDVWAEIQMLQLRLKQKKRNFSDSAVLLREERDL